MQCAKSLLGRCFMIISINLELPELDKVQTIKELLCVEYGLISLPLFDVSQIDFVLESLCTR